MTIPYDEFEQYLSHFVHIVPPDGLKEGHMYVLLTDDSPYGKMSVDYYDIAFAEDGETLSFSYDIISSEKVESVTDDFKKYLGDLLVTIVIQSLNELEEKHATGIDNSIKSNNQ